MTNYIPYINRLKKNYQHQGKWAKRKSYDAYRIYEKDIPEFPYIVDIYLDSAILFERANSQSREKFTYSKDEMIDATEEALGIPRDKIYFKVRERKRGQGQYKRIAKDQHFYQVRESDLTFIVNLADYIDTGLFLDHRPLRQRLLQLDGAGKDFLNLFSYTSTVSVAAAKSGFKTTSVDLSNTYLNWAKDNFSANKLDATKHSFIRENIDIFFQEALEKVAKRFDLIYMDPPTFSNSKKMAIELDVQRDHEKLIRQACRLLKPEGLLVFSTNRRGFKMSSSIESDFVVRDVTQASIPDDFRNKKIHHCFEIKKSANSLISLF